LGNGATFECPTRKKGGKGSELDRRIDVYKVLWLIECLSNKIFEEVGSEKGEKERGVTYREGK